MLRRNRLALAVSRRDGDICWICGLQVKQIITRKEDLGNNSVAASVDHVVPVTFGGTRKLDNLKLAHRCCNVRRGNRVVTDELRAACRKVVQRIDAAMKGEQNA